MKLTAEMSLYPLQENYIPIIRAFIEDAAKKSGVTLVSNAMSTQVCGDWATVIELVDQCLRASTEQKFLKKAFLFWARWAVRADPVSKA